MCFSYAVLPDCKSHPCAHGGVCIVTANDGYTCGCKNDYFGRRCQSEFLLVWIIYLRCDKNAHIYIYIYIYIYICVHF